MVGSELAFLGGSGFGLFEVMSPGFGPAFRSKITLQTEAIYNVFSPLKTHQTPSQLSYFSFSKLHFFSFNCCSSSPACSGTCRETGTRGTRNMHALQQSGPNGLNAEGPDSDR